MHTIGIYDPHSAPKCECETRDRPTWEHFNRKIYLRTYNAVSNFCLCRKLLFSQFKYEFWCVKSVMDGARARPGRRCCCDSSTSISGRSNSFRLRTIQSILLAALPISAKYNGERPTKSETTHWLIWWIYVGWLGRRRTEFVHFHHEDFMRSQELIITKIWPKYF